MFEIADLPLAGGRIGISCVPGRYDDYASDIEALLSWRPNLVLTMTSDIELEAIGAEDLPSDLAKANVEWCHFPITDFRAPCAAALSEWPDVKAQAMVVLSGGGKVLVHCYNGCGRSGMAVLKLMIEAGEDREAAIDRLRTARPGAVESVAQATWACAAAPIATAAR